MPSNDLTAGHTCRAIPEYEYRCRRPGTFHGNVDRAARVLLKCEILRQDSILLRPAQPSYSEGIVFARYMDQAADGFFRFMLGQRAETIIASAFHEPNHSLSYEYVTFADLEGELVGMSSAYTGAQLREFSGKPLQRAAGRSAFRLKCMSVLLRPVFRVLNNVADDGFYLQGIAVKPGLRSKGIGSTLLAGIEQRARLSKSSSLCLDVANKNKGAQTLYRRMGMIESSQWPSVGVLPPLFVRMTKAL